MAYNNDMRKIKNFCRTLIKSNIERKHKYHLYVVADFDARSSITDLLNDAYGARKLSNLYSVSQTILITFITILPFNRLKLEEQKFQLKFRNIRKTIKNKILTSQSQILDVHV